MNAATDGIRLDRVRNLVVMMERTAHGACAAAVRGWAAQFREAIGDVEPEQLPEFKVPGELKEKRESL